MNPEDAFDIDMMLWNNSPQADLLELTPAEVHTLLYEPYSTDAVLQMATNIDEDVLNAMPLFRMAETFLAILQREGAIKLTAKGALPKTVVKELYATGFLPEMWIESGLYKISGESSCIGIQTARIVSSLAGFVRKEKGKLFLTKVAKECLAKGNRLKFFHQFFRAFTEKYSWGYHDNYPDAPVGQRGWAFSLYTLLIYGASPRPASFYAEKYLRAFPNMLSAFDNGIRTAEDSFFNCYETRLFERGLVWLGLVHRKSESLKKWFEPGEYSNTSVLSQIFSIDRR